MIAVVPALAVGAMGDAYGLRTALLWSAGLATLGIPFVLFLPADGDRRRKG